MKIVYIAGTLNSGGAERELINQIKALNKLQHKVFVITLGRNDQLENEIVTIIPKLYHLGDNQNRIIRAIKIINTLNYIKPDIVHSQHFYTNLYALLSTYLLNIKSIGSIQSNLINELNSNGIFGIPSFKYMNYITANSQLAITNLVKYGYPTKKVYYLPNGIDTSSFLIKKNKQTNKKVIIVSIGRLVPAKRFDKLLKIVKGIKNNRYSFEVWIVGDGELRNHLIQLNKQLSLEKIVKFIGIRQDISNILKQADIFILTSDYEGMPNVIQEAMASNLPIISSCVGGIPALISHGVNGYLINPDNIEDFIYFTNKLINNKKLRRTMGKLNRKKIEDNFSLDKLGERLDYIYNRILNDTK
jgi:glycosyltransferase involved in cell wall biosynthesis